jgi:hypothetical protein
MDYDILYYPSYQNFSSFWQKSYFHGLKINIEPYVKWIKKNFFWKSRLEWTGE